MDDATIARHLEEMKQASKVSVCHKCGEPTPTSDDKMAHRILCM